MVLVFFPLDWLFVSGRLLAAVIHVVFFLKLHALSSVLAARPMGSRPSGRERLYAMCLLEMLAAAVLTVSPAFIACFVLFVTAGVTVLLFASSLARAGEPPLDWTTGLRSSLAHGVVILLLAFALFALFPRFGGGGGFSLGGRPKAATTGMSGRVSLGDFGKIKKNQEVVMRIVARGVWVSPPRWRGEAFDRYAGGKWEQRVPALMVFPSDREYRFTLGEEADPVERVTSEVFLEPAEIDVFFLPPGSIELASTMRHIYADPYETLHMPEPPSAGARYVVSWNAIAPPGASSFQFARGPRPLPQLAKVPPAVSRWDGGGTLPPDGLMALRLRAWDPRASPKPSARLAKVPPVVFRRDEGGTPTSVGPSALRPPEVLPGVSRELYLDLPPLSADFYRLARSIAPNGTPSETASAIEAFLRSNYRYTLVTPRARRADPVEDFLFDARAGHCEYFATAMAALLRARGIPSRFVTGFQRGERNLVGNYEVIRQAQAHAWVEAFMPDRGWVTFDPTPGSDEDDAEAGSFVSKSIDSIQMLWDKYVVNFDRSEQLAFVSGLPEAVDFWKAVAVYLWHELKPHAGLIASVLLTVVIITLLVARWWRRGGRRALARALWALERAKPHADSAESASAFYGVLLARLDRLGFARPAGVTPQEYAQSLEPRLPGLSDLTRLYYEVRYGGRILDAAEEARAHQLALSVEIEALSRGRKP